MIFLFIVDYSSNDIDNHFNRGNVKDFDKILELRENH